MQGKKWMERICRRYSEILGEQLTGIYLHGSAAFGCAPLIPPKPEDTKARALR